jgi:hypothetical protein
MMFQGIKKRLRKISGDKQLIQIVTTHVLCFSVCNVHFEDLSERSPLTEALEVSDQKS